jgi:hypothetical protein
MPADCPDQLEMDSDASAGSCSRREYDQTWCVDMTWEAKARARHRLESESSGVPAARGEPVGWLLRADARMLLRAGISTITVYRADPINRGREIKRYLPSPMFVMGNFLCGVPCRGSHGSAHNGVGSETAVEQMSQQVMAASSTRPEECYANFSSPTIYPMRHRHEILRARTKADDSEEHVMSTHQVWSYHFEESSRHNPVQK